MFDFVVLIVVCNFLQISVEHLYIHMPHVRQHSFVENGHEIISTAILSLPLIQEGQLSVTSERMCTKLW